MAREMVLRLDVGPSFPGWLDAFDGCAGFVRLCGDATAELFSGFLNRL